ncbi:MAG: SDR family NAD(P)-dependent oxidoreductase [Gammaproteobacteria bacterium]|nr:SDR family NAD(P)-dependent oxidoreductase [Gammaproteobacteria bacterium]
MDMQNGVAIVTGSSSGVGAACARQLAELGAHVVINYSRNEQGARETEAACTELGAETLVVQADVSDDEQCRALAKAAEDRWGRIDALVNNAGTTKFVAHPDLEGLSSEDFLRIYAVNTLGPFMMSRAVVPAMQRGKRGSIVNVSSVAGVMGVGSSIAYAASKGALNTMTLSLARALGPYIRVNTICPGFIQGDWLRGGLGDDAYEASKRRVEESSPLNVASTPDDIAAGVLYFIVGADVITGETLIMDGGSHLSTAGLTKR